MPHRTIGELLSKSIPCAFIDADDFHSAENKEKMRNGIPLTDEDRLPWLEVLRDELANYVRKGEWVVLACSALVSRYREILCTADPCHRVDNKQEGVAHNLSDVNLATENSRHAGYIGKFLFVHLKCSLELLESRLAVRHKEGKHFMPPSLLRSQLDLLDSREGDERVIGVDASLSPDDIVNSIKHELLLKV